MGTNSRMLPPPVTLTANGRHLSVICPLPDPEDILGEFSPSLHQDPSEQQNFDPVVDCADGSVWDEQSPNRVHYRIEWRVKFKNRVVVKDTKQDLTQPPRFY